MTAVGRTGSWSGRGATGLLTLALAVGLAAGCTSTGTDGPVPEAVPTVEVAVGDQDLSVEGPVPAGRVVFNVRNTGENTHRMVLFPLADDRPPIHDDIADDVERPMQVMAGVPPLAPGETTAFAVDLGDERRYGMVDTIEVADGRQYMDLGVATEFRAGSVVSASAPATPSPSLDQSPGD